jgi:hypothetical protein
VHHWADDDALSCLRLAEGRERGPDVWHGIGGLRVADAAVMPRNVPGNISASVSVIAETDAPPILVAAI